MESGYNDLQSAGSKSGLLTALLLPRQPTSATEPELGGLPPLHKHWRSIPAAASLTLSTFQPDCANSLPAAAHVRRSDRLSPPPAACDRLPRSTWHLTAALWVCPGLRHVSTKVKTRVCGVERWEDLPES